MNSEPAAAAIQFASRIVGAPEAREQCLCCGRLAPFPAIALDQSRGWLLAGVCKGCLEAAGEQRASDVAALASAADRVCSLLELIRSRAGRELSGWYGEIGNCSEADVDDARVALRRALERLPAVR